MISIEEKINSLGLTNQELSVKLDINPSTLSRFLSGKNEVKFETLFQLIHTIYDLDEQPETCRFYFLRLQNKRNIKCALEYFSTNKDWKELKYLIDREKNSPNKELMELVFYYEAFYRIEYLNETINDVNKSGEGFVIHSKEAKVFNNVIRLYSGTLLDNYTFIYQGKDDTLQSIDTLDDSYFKNSLKNRVYRLMIYASMHSNDLDEMQVNVDNILGNYTCLYFKASAYYHLSKIESLTSFDKAMKSLSDSMYIFKLLKLDKYIQNMDNKLLPFICFFHDTVVTDPAFNCPNILKVYFLYKNGDIEGSRRQFNECINRDVIYYHMVKGILFDDINSIWMSLIKSINYKNTFYTKLPIKLLIQKGVSIEDIKDCINVNGTNLI